MQAKPGSLEANFATKRFHSTLTIFYLFRFTIGFTLGLYVFTYGSVIVDGLSQTHLEIISFFGFDLSPIRWAAIIFSLGTLFEVFLEIPTGIIADLIGRKFVTIVSLVARACFFLCFYFVLNFSIKDHYSPSGIIVSGIIGITFFSLSYSLMSGAFTAWFRDTLEEMGQEKEFLSLLGKGEVLYYAAFLASAIIGLCCHAAYLTATAFLFGAIFCLSCAAYCMKFMHENGQYSFVRKNKNSFLVFCKEIQTRTKMILKSGIQILFRDSRLILVFLIVAAAFTLTHLIDYAWLIFFQAYFGSTIQKFSPKWYAMIGILCSSAFLGALFLSRKIRTYLTRLGKNLETSYLIRLNLSFIVLFASPILVLAILLSVGPHHPQLAFWGFVICLAIHKLGWGALKAPLDALQNAFIPSATQERATVLSLGACFKHVVSVTLFIFGMGNDVKSLTSWTIPAGTLLVLSLLFYIKILQKK